MLVRRLAPFGIFVLVSVAVLAPLPARAQYFGRNKVQYETFRFQVLATEHFDVYYYEEERRVAEQAARMAERWYSRLSKAFDHELHGRQPLILYASHPHFEQTNAIPGELDESTGGVTESMKRRIVLPVAASLGETDHVIGHELVHAFQYDLQRRGQSNLSNPGLQLPLWFVEGMAEYLSIGPADPHTSMWMRDAALRKKLPTLGKLNSSRYFPYRFGQALWAFVAARWGESRVGEIFKAASGRGATAEKAFEMVLGTSADSLSREWQRVTAEWAETAGPDREGGRVVLGPRGERGRINVSPSLSPDGRLVAFLSERDAYSIELFLADAQTGRILRRLTKSALDPHLQSLQFIQSAGAFSPDGRRIAIATVQGGQPALAILDVNDGRTLQRIRLPELGEVYHPTWSPDGRRVAYSGLSGGFTDLYVLDLGTRRSQRLTDDLYADLQPAWSPDGHTLAFATDRFGTHLGPLEYAEPRLALLDLDTREIRPLSAADQGKNINPQWSRDGRSIFFVSDRTGISNVYRVSAQGGALAQVTDVATGVSGITRLSPALAVAREADRMIFGVFHDTGYRLNALEGAALEGSEPRGPATLAAVLPPALGNASSTAVADAALPAVEQFQRRKYRAGLSLDAVGQLGVGASTGSGGLAVGGGSAFLWSDMLGDHNLFTQVQLNSSEGGFSNNFGGVLAYTNLKQRWNWGLQLSQIPYFTREFEVTENPATDRATTRDLRFWQIDRQVQGVVYYPLNRVQRFELGAGYRAIDFKSEVETHFFEMSTGLEVANPITEPGPWDSIPSIHLFQGMAAAVYDNSVFGGTSPILGQRSRFELAPVLGDLQYLNLLADYRRYQRLTGPLTLAGRGLHYGRYGRDSESDRIGELFLGYPWIVRGYDANSFTAEECDGSPDCEKFDKLFGSRLAVANLELRLPLVGALGAFPTPGVPPIEAAIFYDAGVAWSEADKAKFLGGDRDAVTSYGTALRLNLLGFAVAEIAYVHPNDRPIKGWYWLLALQPGF